MRLPRWDMLRLAAPFALWFVAACSWLKQGDAHPESRFVRLSHAYDHAVHTHGDSVQLLRYELQTVVPASRMDVLEGKKEHIAEQLIAGPDAPAKAVDQPGDLLGRIWTVFGPPQEGRLEDQFRYTFLDTHKRLVFSVSSWEAGEPNYVLLGSYDGALPPPPVPDSHFHPDDTPAPRFTSATYGSGVGVNNRPVRAAAEERLQESANAFEELLAKKPLADCALMVKTDFGLFKIGARDGQVIDGEVSFAEAVDYYANLVKTYGPQRDVPVLDLAEPQLQIYWLWTEATPEERASRPSALQHARAAWQRELAHLSQLIVLDDQDRSEWHMRWGVLSEGAPRVGFDTPEWHVQLAKLREPPPAPALSAAEIDTLRSALSAKSTESIWSPEERERRAQVRKQRAAQGPEFDADLIVARLEKSDAPTDRAAASRLRAVLDAAPKSTR